MHASKLRPYDVRINEVMCVSMCFVNNEIGLCADDYNACDSPFCDQCELARANACSVIYEKDEEFGAYN